MRHGPWGERQAVLREAKAGSVIAIDGRKPVAVETHGERARLLFEPGDERMAIALFGRIVEYTYLDG